MTKKKVELKPFQAGQVWKVADTSWKIDLVGKTLVHFKRYKLTAKGVRTSLSSEEDLKNYLTEKKAVLVQQ